MFVVCTVIIVLIHSDNFKCYNFTVHGVLHIKEKKILKIGSSGGTAELIKTSSGQWEHLDSYFILKGLVRKSYCCGGSLAEHARWTVIFSNEEVR